MDDQVVKVLKDSMDRMERNTSNALRDIKKELTANSKDTQAIKTYISNQKAMFWTGGTLVAAAAGVVTWLTNVATFFGGHAGKGP